MAIGIPAHRCVLSIFPIELDHEWRHNGLTHYTHAAAPRDKILRRTFSWNVGLYCPEHPLHEQSNADLQGGYCQFQIDKRTRCNVKLEERPRWIDEYTDCEKDQGYAVYVLHDTRSWNRDWGQDKEVFRADGVDAQSIVTDFVTVYGSGMIGSDKGLRPGIIAMAGDYPTEDELQKARQMQTAHFEFLYHDAVALHADGKTREITNLHRVACSWLGRNDLPFLRKIQQRSLKPCPACGEDIMYEAMKCKHCNESLPEWYQRYGVNPTDNNDEIVSAFLAKLPAKGRVLYAKKETAPPAATPSPEPVTAGV